MTIWIDPPAWPAHDRLWSHLVSDVSVAELQEFADRMGIPRRAFEGDHYDVPQERYADLVAAGAPPSPGGRPLSLSTGPRRAGSAQIRSPCRPCRHRRRAWPERPSPACRR